MNDKFDELAKELAQSVTRRGALKKFGVGLAGIALASLGLVSKAQAGSWRSKKCLENCLRHCAQGDSNCYNRCSSLCHAPIP